MKTESFNHLPFDTSSRALSKPKGHSCAPRGFNKVGLALVWVFTFAVTAPAANQSYLTTRHVFADAVKLPVSNIQRAVLTKQELSEVLHFSIALKMRNFNDLEARIGRGERVSQRTMEADYLPAASDYQSLRNWLVAQGFTVTQKDPNHTNVFATGSVQQIQHTFGVTFARVTTAYGEFTSSISQPSLPKQLSGAVLSINGLQPHVRLHHRRLTLQPQIVIDPNGNQAIAPGDILAAYTVPSNLTGAGQTIAIIMGATVQTSDLTTFYSTTGSPQTASNLTTVLVNGGPDATSQSDDASEATMDVEWAGAMAPGAKIRLYAISSVQTSNIIAACSQILADAESHKITVVSISAADLESHYTSSTLQSCSQTFAQLAAAGITVVVSSGDGGSNPNTDYTLGYKFSNPLQVEYPASDPNVCGVGGTAISLSSGSFSYLGETAWSEDIINSMYSSGGGVSSIFSRPLWQTDNGSILTNAYRCVPDVAAISSGPMSGNNMYIFGFLNGVSPAGGTSLSAPVWAGIVADINQARANNGLPSLGLLGPAIYPLNGTNCFNDITTGNNGAYFADPGYDLCTGLGTPNVANLAFALSRAAPSITNQPKSGTVATGSSFSLNFTAVGTAPFTYQWYRNGIAITGATNSTYSVASATSADAAAYTVTVANSIGIVTSASATVTIFTPPPSSGGGGGGALSWWFYLFFALIAAIRRVNCAGPN